MRRRLGEVVAGGCLGWFGVGSEAGQHESGGDAYLEPYREAVRQVGPRFEALLWNSVQTQEARFAALIDAIEPVGRTIADLGCGRADLAAWMTRQGVAPARYVGVDGLGEMIEFARDRAKDGSLGLTRFIHCDFVADGALFNRLVRRHHVDTLVFSGSLNTLEQGTARAVLDQAWRATSRRPGAILAFNFLSDRSGRSDDTGPARRFDTIKMLQWAMERTPLVRFRQDYLAGNDAMIVMRRPEGDRDERSRSGT